MPRLTRLSTCSLLALGAVTGPAFADLTAVQVWEEMESMMESYGYTISATETASSNGLDVTDLSMEIAIPEENTTVRVGIETVSFVDVGDGSVRVVFPETLPIAVAAAPEGDEDVNLVIDYSNTGLDLVVSGDPGNMLYTYSADSLRLALSELTVDGETIGRDVARFDVNLNGLAGTSNSVNGDGRQIAQNVKVSGVTYDLAFNDPESEDSGLLSGSAGEMSIVGSTNLPEGFDASDPQSFVNGFSAEGTFSYANGQMEFAASEGAGTTTGTTQSDAVTLNFALNSEMMSYDGEASGMALSLSGPDVPLPVNVTMARSAFNIAAPLAASDKPEDVALGLTLGGFEMSDLLWNIFDPGAALPRDPATIALSLTGQVTPFVNLFDPASMAQFETSGEAPGELNALTLNELTVEAAGAKLGGSGSFTFDNTDLQTFGGFPRPSGALDLSLDGANGLIDKLIAMGLVTNEDALGARMMMSMFAVPGTGPDNLKSSIEINDQGHVLANGLRIQ